MHTNDAPTTPSKAPATRSRFARLRGAAAVVTMMLSLVGANAVIDAAPASAATLPVSYCSKAWGPGLIGFGLPATSPGVEIDVYLYKTVWNGRAYVPQYQGSYDWAVSNNNSGWQQGNL